MSPRLLPVAAALLAAAPALGQDPDKAALGGRAKEVLGKYCRDCHNGPSSGNGEVDFLDFAALRETAKHESPLVAPGKGADSRLVKRAVKGLAKERGSMPPVEHDPRPTAADVDVLRAWVDAGCPDPPRPPDDQGKRAPVGTLDVLQAIKKHLENIDQEDRAYARYFTLAHLHNDPRVKDADLNVYRAALAEAVNALSWQPRVVQPVAVDPGRTVFAIDLRDVGWGADGWRQVMAEYPYGLAYRFRPPPLPGADRYIQEETDCDVPYVRADWFAATATRPPLYHLLLKLPDHARPLEDKLGVDVGRNFRRNRLARAGVTRSLVSEQHRLVERHDAAYGAYWKSYDFRPAKDRADLKRFPLGPPAFFGPGPGYPPEPGPYPDRAFQHAGGEIIFNLPNGLQGYLLVDDKDVRIDKGPTDIVADSNRTTGTTEVVNGVSCMACHARGMKRFQDVIRDEAEVRNREYRKVELLYPMPVRMTALVAEDEDRFARAMDKVVGGHLPAGGVRAGSYTDPAGWACKKHLDSLDLQTAAAELGTTADDVTRKLGLQGLKDLGLGAFAKPDGKVRRQDWERGDYCSLMQRAAERLELGNAIPRAK